MPCLLLLPCRSARIGHRPAGVAQGSGQRKVKPCLGVGVSHLSNSCRESCWGGERHWGGPVLPLPSHKAPQKWRRSTALIRALGAEALRGQEWEWGRSRATAGFAVGVNCRCVAQGLRADALLFAGSYGMDSSLNWASRV